MQNQPNFFMTSDEYFDALPEDRREPARRLFQVIRDNIQSGFEEQFSSGFPSFVVPHSVYPAGYHCNPKLAVPFVSVANFKGHIGFYAFCVYMDGPVKEWFLKEAASRGVKLDMGKGCVRFKDPNRIPYDLVGELVAKVGVQGFLDQYTAGLRQSSPRK
jgi:hypothetical protein